MDMDAITKLISALALFAWPALVAIVIYIFHTPIRELIGSILGRKLVVKVGEYELSIEEASEQQRKVISDIQQKVAELEDKLNSSASRLRSSAQLASASTVSEANRIRRMLWVDDNPKNNSFLVAFLKERGVTIDIAQNTEDGIKKLKQTNYDWIVSDMSRPEGDRAGIDFTLKVRDFNKTTPIYIFCGAWGARNLQTEASKAGVNGITSSSTTLLSMLH